MKYLVFFVVLAFVISWGVWLPLYANKIGMHIPYALPFQHALGAYGPMLAAVVTSFIFRKDHGDIC